LHEKTSKGGIERIKKAKRTWGKAILYAEEDITMPDTNQWLDYNWIKDIPHPYEYIRKSEPVCTVIADGSNRDDCFEHLMKRAEFAKERVYQ